ncbi:hypothetical protein K8354_07725 [Polaribacter litorisediminis]|uniref:hypothetical protein n=1 Tax=Polaribacter litorisediminis TaxID=1908341 RepID=UPI001CBFB3D6|nr:hypothetical protein [Polaribacter litorisediminis]UAM99683.1 hypothetical protein K8354_07725 [Polaribacter litorisediminis]
MNSFFTFFKQSSILKAILAIVLFIFNLMTTVKVDKISEIYKTLKSENNTIFESEFQTNKMEKLEPVITENFEFYSDGSEIDKREEFVRSAKTNLDLNPGTYSRNLTNNSLAVFVLKNKIDETAF